MNGWVNRWVNGWDDEGMDVMVDRWVVAGNNKKKTIKKNNKRIKNVIKRINYEINKKM